MKGKGLFPVSFRDWAQGSLFVTPPFPIRNWREGNQADLEKNHRDIPHGATMSPANLKILKDSKVDNYGKKVRA